MNASSPEVAETIPDPRYNQCIHRLSFIVTRCCFINMSGIRACKSETKRHKILYFENDGLLWQTSKLQLERFVLNPK
jgi:hypothetical protein